MATTKIRLTVALPKPMHREISDVASYTGIIPAEVIRQSVRLGLPKFVKSFPRPESKAGSTSGK